MVRSCCADFARRSVPWLALLALFTAPLVAAKLRLSGAGGIPNVDADGNLDLENLTLGTVSFKINTKNFKVRVTGTGNVENLSDQDQKYKNSPELHANLEGNGSFTSVERSLYKVKADGAADLKVSGHINPEILP